MKTEIKHKLLCNFDHSSMKAVHRTVKHDTQTARHPSLLQKINNRATNYKPQYC